MHTEGRAAPRRAATAPLAALRRVAALVAVLAAVLAVPPAGTVPAPGVQPLDTALVAWNTASPPPFTSTSSTHSEAYASWALTPDSDGPQSYDVELRRADGSVYAEGTLDHPSNSVYADELPYGKYRFAVRVNTRGGFLGAQTRTSAWSVSPLVGLRPSTPTGLTATGGDRSVQLRWTATPAAETASYSVLRGSQRIDGIPASATSWTDTGRTNGTELTYSLIAVNSDGLDSAPSSSVKVTPRDTVRPSPVTGLRSEGTTDGSGQTRLSWTPSTSSDADRQRVVRNGSVVAELPASTTSYTDTAAVDVLQRYSISVVDDDGLVSQNDPETSQTPRDQLAPAVPRGLAATAGDGSVALSWTAGTESDLASYKVLRDGAVVATVTAPTTSYTDTGRTNGTEYRYALQSVDTHGNTSAASSPAVAATPVDTTPPAVPTGLAAVRGDTQVSLTWNQNTESDLAGYDLFRRQAGASSSVRVSGAVLGPSATSWTDTGLTNDVEYTYTLRAKDGDGNTSASSPGVSATPTDLTPPAVPARPSAVAGDGRVTLSWTASSETDLASYQVLRDGSVIATVTKPTTTYTDSSVTNGTTYGYALKAVDTHGNASAATTPPVSATPHDQTPPAVPTGLTATRGDGRVTLSWTASTETDLASYRLLRGGAVVATIAAPATTYTDTGLTNDTTYGYSLAAVDTTGNGSAASSPEVSATPTDLTPPARPSGVTSTAGDGLVDTSWQANTEPDLASYRVYRDGQLITTIRVVAAPGTTPTSYRDQGLANGAAHTYAVTAVDTHGNESPASTTSATPTDTTAPAAPTGLSATPADRQAALTWTASPDRDVATYRVLRDGAEVGTVPAGTTSFTDTGLTNGRAHTYSVVAVDGSGNRSPASGTTTTTPRDAVAPAAPTAVSATPGSGSATVRWTAPADTDLATYRVLRADGTVAATVAAPATSAVVTGLTNGSPYTFTVVVVDTSGNSSSASASASVTVTPAATSVPSQGAGQSGALAVSPDGRWLVVASTAPLESTDTNGAQELYRIDTTGAVPPRRVAPIAAGGPTAALNASDVAVSGDGRYVVLATTEALSPRDSGSLLDVYRGDLSTTPTTWTLVSAPTSGTASPSVAGTLLQTGTTVYATSPGLAVSADGSRVLFYSARDDLVTGDGNGAVDVFAKDLLGSDPGRGPVTRVSTGSGGGAMSPARTATGPALALTPDGRYAVFTATGSSGPLVALRKDLGTTAGTAASASGPVAVVSSTPPVSATGGRQVEVAAYRDTGDVAISDDGRYVAFVSATKLTSASPTASASTGLAYRKDMTTGAVAALGSGQTTVWEHQVGLSPDGSFGTFSTTAGLVASDTNGHTDVYGRDLSTGGPLVLVTSSASGSAVTSPSAPVSSSEYGRTKVLGGGLVLVVTVQPLLPGDTNGTRDVYRKDLSDGSVVALVTS